MIILVDVNKAYLETLIVMTYSFHKHNKWEIEDILHEI